MGGIFPQHWLDMGMDFPCRKPRTWANCVIHWAMKSVLKCGNDPSTRPLRTDMAWGKISVMQWVKGGC